MGGRGRRTITIGAVVAAVGLAMLATPAAAGGGASERARDVAEHWSAERMAQATPRDLVLDDRGRAFTQGADGRLSPHGHTRRAEVRGLHAAPAARPDGKPGGGKPGGGGGGGGSDTTGPTITNLSPDGNAVIGETGTFSSTVTDPSGIRSVDVRIEFPLGSTPQTFPASASGDTWSATVSGFAGQGVAGRWQAIARDGARKGGNTSTSGWATFVVDDGGSGGGGGGGGETVVDAPWTAGGAVQTAAGRIYFEMPANSRLTRWNGYVCSGTVASDGTAGRSVIITAAHCVYDDVYKVFARNVLFIPNQDQTTGSGTDTNCSNDPLGCWAPKWGVVDTQWTADTFPDNIPWDYAYYVVDDTGAHSGTAAGSDVLDQAAGSLPVQFTAPQVGAFTHALGYSYSDDPNFMYCAEDMATEGPDNWWLGSCGLSGGSSGGPWVQPMDAGTGSGPIISVNSWGYSNQPGMAGPKLNGTSAQCLFDAATAAQSQTEPRGIVPAAC